MGFRFRKTIKVLPGVRVNLSKSGVSTSLGGPGATINIGGKRRPRVTVGLPGTGLSYREELGISARSAARVVQVEASEPAAAAPAVTNAAGRSRSVAILIAVFVVVLLVGLAAQSP